MCSQASPEPEGEAPRSEGAKGPERRETGWSLGAGGWVLASWSEG